MEWGRMEFSDASWAGPSGRLRRHGTPCHEPLLVGPLKVRINFLLPIIFFHSLQGFFCRIFLDDDFLLK